MTDIQVRPDPATGGAVIEIRGAETGETRFRLRDPYTEKFLTRRGWSKNAGFLPGEAVRDGEILRIAISADLARKVSPGTKLVLEQPAADIQEIVAWPEPVADAPASADDAETQDAEAHREDSAAASDSPSPPEETIADAPTMDAASSDPGAVEPHMPALDTAPSAEQSDDALAAAADADLKAALAASDTRTATDHETKDAAETADASPAVESDAAAGRAGRSERTRELPPLLLDSFEPSIMHDRVQDEDKPDVADEPRPEPAPSMLAKWKPAAIAAAVCLLIGTGSGYVLGGAGESAGVRQAQEAAAIQLEKQQWEFDRRLKQAETEASAAVGDRSKASQAELATVTAARDTALRSLADKEKSVSALQQQLSDAQAQIEAVRNAAGDEAKAQIDAQQSRLDSLAAELQTAKSDLETRDGELQQGQSRLAALEDQLAARDRDLKSLQARLDTATNELASVRDAAKAEQASSSKALDDRVETLTAQLGDKDKLLSERDAALRDLQAKLSVANIQIDALKVVANKTTEAGLERTALSEKLEQLTAELDKTSQNLSDREQTLAETSARLKEAEARLAAAATDSSALVAQQQAANPVPGNSDARLPAGAQDSARLQEERDLYAEELKSMTASFTALQKEKQELEKTVAALRAGGADAELTTSQIPSKAVWGATAIDQNGAIYSLQNQVSEKIAKDNVAAMCRGKSGSRCESLSSYSNACFSVARFEGENPSADNFAYFVHKDWKTASATARERCESMGGACTVRFTACSPDMLSKPVSE